MSRMEPSVTIYSSPLYAGERQGEGLFCILGRRPSPNLSPEYEGEEHELNQHDSEIKQPCKFSLSFWPARGALA